MDIADTAIASRSQQFMECALGVCREFKVTIVCMFIGSLVK